MLLRVCRCSDFCMQTCIILFMNSPRFQISEKHTFKFEVWQEVNDSVDNFFICYSQGACGGTARMTGWNGRNSDIHRSCREMKFSQILRITIQVGVLDLNMREPNKASVVNSWTKVNGNETWRLLNVPKLSFKKKNAKM